MAILYSLILILLVVIAFAIRWCLSLNKQNTEISDILAEIDHKEWLTKRRANMTQAQRESEDLHFSQLRAMPPSEVFKPRAGNSLSKDLLGFDLLSK